VAGGIIGQMIIPVPVLGAVVGLFQITKEIFLKIYDKILKIHFLKGWFVNRWRCWSCSKQKNLKNFFFISLVIYFALFTDRPSRRYTFRRSSGNNR